MSAVVDAPYRVGQEMRLADGATGHVAAWRQRDDGAVLATLAMNDGTTRHVEVMGSVAEIEPPDPEAAARLAHRVLAGDKVAMPTLRMLAAGLLAERGEL